MKLHSDYRRSDRAQRRGMATLETVLALPFLLACFALIIAVSMASIRKSEVAIAARNEAFQVRTDTPDEEPFVLFGIATDGQARSIKTNTFTLPPPPVSTGQTATAESHSQILTGSWSDDRAGLWEESDDFVPHLKPMIAMASQGMVSVPEIGSLGRTIKDLPGGKVLGYASKGLNGLIYGAGQYFRGLSAFGKVLNAISTPLRAVSAATKLLDIADDLTPDFLIDKAFDVLDEFGLGGLEDAKDAVKTASKIVDTLTSLQDRIQQIFEALYKASLGEDYKPDPAGLPIEELKSLLE